MRRSLATTIDRAAAPSAGTAFLRRLRFGDCLARDTVGTSTLDVDREEAPAKPYTNFASDFRRYWRPINRLGDRRANYSLKKQKTLRQKPTLAR